MFTRVLAAPCQPASRPDSSRRRTLARQQTLWRIAFRARRSANRCQRRFVCGVTGHSLTAFSSLLITQMYDRLGRPGRRCLAHQHAVVTGSTHCCSPSDGDENSRSHSTRLTTVANAARATDLSGQTCTAVREGLQRRPQQNNCNNRQHQQQRRFFVRPALTDGQRDLFQLLQFYNKGSSITFSR